MASGEVKKTYTASDVDALLGKNDLGNIINLTEYTSNTNYYTFPSDGYVFLSNTDGAAGRGIIAGRTSSFFLQIGNAVGRWSMPVKKGMRTYCEATPSIYRFVPLS